MRHEEALEALWAAIARLREAVEEIKAMRGDVHDRKAAGACQVCGQAREDATQEAYGSNTRA